MTINQENLVRQSAEAPTTEKKGLWKRIKALGATSKSPPATLAKKQRPPRLSLEKPSSSERHNPGESPDTFPHLSQWHRHSTLGFSTQSPSGRRSFTSNRLSTHGGTKTSENMAGTVGSKSLMEIMAFASSMEGGGIEVNAKQAGGRTGQAYWEDLRKSVMERRSSALSGSTLAALSDAQASRASVASATTLASIPAHPLTRTKQRHSASMQVSEEKRDTLLPLNRRTFAQVKPPVSPGIRSLSMRARTQSARSEVSGYTCNSLSSIGEHADYIQPRYREATALASFPMVMQPSFSGRSCTVNFGRMSEESSPRSAFDGESAREMYAGRLQSPVIDGVELEREFTRYIEERFKFIMDVKE